MLILIFDFRRTFIKMWLRGWFSVPGKQDWVRCIIEELSHLTRLRVYLVKYRVLKRSKLPLRTKERKATRIFHLFTKDTIASSDASRRNQPLLLRLLRICLVLMISNRPKHHEQIGDSVNSSDLLVWVLYQSLASTCLQVGGRSLL